MNKMNGKNDLNITATLIQVAHMYYEENLSQKQIADELNVSRSLIGHYLKRARDQGIVRIEITNPQDHFEDLSIILRVKANLDQVTVVPGSHKSADLTRRAIAGALARHLENTLEDGDCVGIGFGRTMAEVADLLVPTRSRAIDVVPLVGESSSGLVGTYSQVNLHILKIASVFSGTPHFLLAPLMVNSPSLQKLLLEDDGVQEIVKYWDKLSHICVGVGTLPPVTGEVIYIGEEKLAIFQKAGGVGDVCSRYFDAAGKFIDVPIYDRLIGIREDQMRKAKHFMVVANGAGKSDAVISLLRSQMVTDLFVDEELAQTIIEKWQ